MKVWAHGGNEAIGTVNQDNFGIEASELTLVCLFN